MKFIPYIVGGLAGVSAVSQKRLIKTSEDGAAVWLAEQEILTLLKNQTHFMDITEVGEAPNTAKEFKASRVSFPKKMHYSNFINPMFSKIDVGRMKEFLTKYSSFNNRYYMSETGIEASNWLQAQIKKSINGLNITIEPVSHSFPQQSVIVRIPGSDPTLADEVVIIGAHLDSINTYSPTNGRAPGADDDGSGTTTNLEAFRVLTAAHFKPKRTVEFHWYAGEEKGLLGSQDIAKGYYLANKKVVAMAQFDMVGYLSNHRKIAMITDFTHQDLTQFLRKLIDTYLDIEHTNSRCGYACSDHASWSKYGFPSAFPFEDAKNPYIHTPKDTLDKINFDNIKEFVKLAIAYLVEMAEPAIGY